MCVGGVYCGNLIKGITVSHFVVLSFHPPTPAGLVKELVTELPLTYLKLMEAMD